MSHTFVICGDDKRYRHLAELLIQDKHNVYLWGCSFTCENAHTVCTLYTLTQPVVLILPFTVQDAEQIYALKTVSAGSVVMGGALKSEGAVIVREKRLIYHNLLSDTLYKHDNAVPTAEGVLSLVIGETDRVLYGRNILLFGYGHVGKATAKVFSACGAHVTVASVSEEELSLAKEAGCQIQKLPFHEGHTEGLDAFDCCINTIPCPGIVNEDIIRAFSPHILLVEVASGGNNICYSAAEDRGIRTLRAMSLPGKIAPRSAAEYIRSAVYRHL